MSETIVRQKASEFVDALIEHIDERDEAMAVQLRKEMRDILSKNAVVVESVVKDANSATPRDAADRSKLQQVRDAAAVALDKHRKTAKAVNNGEEVEPEQVKEAVEAAAFAQSVHKDWDNWRKLKDEEIAGLRTDVEALKRDKADKIDTTTQVVTPVEPTTAQPTVDNRKVVDQKRTRVVDFEPETGPRQAPAPVLVEENRYGGIEDIPDLRGQSMPTRTAPAPAVAVRSEAESTSLSTCKWQGVDWIWAIVGALFFFFVIGLPIAGVLGGPAPEWWRNTIIALLFAALGFALGGFISAKIRSNRTTTGTARTEVRA